ncbi:uncharacterized protein LOC144564396 [Carex rostrata]
MTIGKIPAKTVKEVTSLMRRFLWGTEEVWQVAGNEDKLWIEVLRAKYFARGGFWSVQTRTGSSNLWRALQDLKPLLKDNLRWSVGDGTLIRAINQPWYEGWEAQRILTNEQRDLTVAALFDHTTQHWDTEKIGELIGIQAISQIPNTAKKPKLQPLISNKLIWMVSKKGSYTTKEGYKMLMEAYLVRSTYSEAKKQAWRKLEKWKDLISRVKLFIWRAIHDGLAKSNEMHRRISTVDPKCVRCGIENEIEPISRREGTNFRGRPPDGVTEFMQVPVVLNPNHFRFEIGTGT